LPLDKNAKTGEKAERPGQALERLVEALQILEDRDPRLRTEINARLRDKITGQMREVDVLLTYQEGNARTRVAIECKDHKRPIDVKEIEALHGKCSDLDIDATMIVSSSGFTRPAILKAGARRIFAKTIEQSLNYDWLNTGGIITDSLRFHAPIALEAETLSGRVPVFELWDVIQKIDPAKLTDATAFALFSDPGIIPWTSDGSTVADIKELGFGFEVEIQGKWRAVDHNGQPIVHSKIHAVGSASYSRYFSSFGYFSYSSAFDSEGNKFAKAPIIKPGSELSELVLGEASPDRAVITRSNPSSEPPRVATRSIIRIVTWDDLFPLLFEVGDRHHLTVNPDSDLFSFARFMHDADVSAREIPYKSADDPWPRGEFTHSGAASITISKEYRRAPRKPHKRRWLITSDSPRR
jgi:hypothetical protein